MLSVLVLFFILSRVAACVGFGGFVTAATVGVAQVLFLVLVLVIMGDLIYTRPRIFKG